MYADRITGSMKRCIAETNRRREIQRRHNEEHGITPRTISKSIEETLLSTRVADARGDAAGIGRVAEPAASYADEVNLEEWANILEHQMRVAAELLDFERAATLRDELAAVRARLDGAAAGGG
jgi:excinuclease ABC subunit B